MSIVRLFPSLVASLFLAFTANQPNFTSASQTALSGAPVELAKQIVKDLDADDWLKSSFQGDLTSLAKSLHVRTIDLNNNGIMEYIIIPTDSLMCGSGGCGLLIYRVTQGGYELIFGVGPTVHDNQLVQGIGDHDIYPTGSLTNGYSDLRIDKAGIGIQKANASLLKFDGRRYRASSLTQQTEISSEPQLHLAFKADDLPKIKGLLAKGIDVNTMDGEGKTALMLAAEDGQIEVTEMFLSKGAAVNLKDKESRTALLLAAQNGHTQIVAGLLKAGADPNAAGGTLGEDVEYELSATLWSYVERTPLMVAAAEGHTEVVKELLTKGALIDTRDSYDLTALMLAAISGRVDTVRVLLAKGAKVDVRNRNGENALMLVSTHLPVSIILADGISAQPDEDDIRTVQKMAKASSAIVEMLVKAGIDPNVTNNRGATALKLFLQRRNLDSAEALLKAGKVKDVNVRDADGATLMHIAVLAKNKTLLEVLLKAGADVNARENLYGATPLHVAVLAGDASIIRLLVTNRADIYAKLNNGQTALDLAKEKSVIEALRDQKQ